jgi:hypothetical protein
VKLSSTFFSLLLLSNLSLLQAQVQLQNVPFTTGGSYAVPGNLVQVATYDPLLDSIVILDSAPGDFSNSIVVHQDKVLAHIGRAAGHPNGEDVVYVYDLRTGELVDSLTQVGGLHRMKIYHNNLVITRGFGASANFFQAYNLDNLTAGPFYNDTVLQGSTNDVVVLGDLAYVSYTQRDSGRLAIIELNQPKPEFVDVISFDTLTSGLDELYTDGTLIYGLAEKAIYPPPNFMETIISAGVLVFDPVADTSHFVALSRARDGIGIDGDYLYANFGSGPGAFDLSGDSLVNNPFFNASYSAARQDSLSGDYYYLATDFFSFGALVRTDALGMVADSQGTDISGSALDLIYNHLPVGREDSFAINTAGGVYPMDFYPLGNDSDADLYDSLFIEEVFGAASGSTTFGMQQGFNEVSITYTPFSQSFWDIDTFYYVLSDGWAGSKDTVMATMTIFQESSIDPVLLGGFDLYPNPARESVVLETLQPLNGETQILLWNLHGQVQHQETLPLLSKQTLDLQQLPAGWYYVEIRHNGRRMLQKLMKQ